MEEIWGIPSGWGWELSWVCRCGDQCPPQVQMAPQGFWGLQCCPEAMLTTAPGLKVPSCVTTVLPQASHGYLLCCFEDGSAPIQLMGPVPVPPPAATARDGGGPRPGRHRWCWHQTPGHPLLPPQDRGGSQGGHTAPCTLCGDHSHAGKPWALELPPPHGTGSWGCRRARSAAWPQLQLSASPGFGTQDRDILQVPPSKVSACSAVPVALAGAQ